MSSFLLATPTLATETNLYLFSTQSITVARVLNSLFVDAVYPILLLYPHETPVPSFVLKVLAEVPSVARVLNSLSVDAVYPILLLFLSS